jgi:hypothetical protein
LFPALRKNKLDPQLPLTPQEHADLCAFVATAQVRTRSSKRHHTKQWQHILDMMDELKESMKTATPEQKRSMARIGAGSKSDKSLSHDQVRQLAKAPLPALVPGTLHALTPVLTQMSMLIFNTDDPIGFVTSDRPVCWFDPTAYRRLPANRHLSIQNKNIEISMPISPRQCVLFYWGEKEGYVDASAAALLEFNQRHVANCDEQFVVRANYTNPAWFVQYPLPTDAWENRAKR